MFEEGLLHERTYFSTSFFHPIQCYNYNWLNACTSRHESTTLLMSQKVVSMMLPAYGAIFIFFYASNPIQTWTVSCCLAHKWCTQTWFTVTILFNNSSPLYLLCSRIVRKMSIHVCFCFLVHVHKLWELAWFYSCWLTFVTLNHVYNTNWVISSDRILKIIYTVHVRLMNWMWFSLQKKIEGITFQHVL